MNKDDFIEMINALDIAKITSFQIEYENYGIDKKEQLLSFNYDN